ncbi:DUF3578 domain-containing protein [Mesorhizobium sp. Z1-4]|uniref:DUF3578 domain-containing protein n=1 Tax=Mesorhizobium sp. Z1-4 TaxID=2448478 RepID=UPI000FD76ADE|nr:DUF3578 domain-containing protein [Mesorhizobium sp. Z1-4]
MIRDTLLEISNSYLLAKTQPFAGHPLGGFLRSQGPEQIRSYVTDPSFIVYGSSGSSGRWTHVPWIGIFDPEVTTGAQTGCYLVYLFSTDMERIYLSMSQGTTEVSNEFDQTKAALAELDRRAALMRDRVPEYKGRLTLKAIDLAATTYFPRGYAAGLAFGFGYDANDIPSEDDLRKDLIEGLRLYRLLVSRGGASPLHEKDFEDEHEDDGSSIERRRYTRHRHIERNSALPKKAKAFHGYRCQACCFDFESAYGELGRHYIEAHHLTP